MARSISTHRPHARQDLLGIHAERHASRLKRDAFRVSYSTRRDGAGGGHHVPPQRCSHYECVCGSRGAAARVRRERCSPHRGDSLASRVRTDVCRGIDPSARTYGATTSHPARAEVGVSGGSLGRDTGTVVEGPLLPLTVRRVYSSGRSVFTGSTCADPHPPRST